MLRKEMSGEFKRLNHNWSRLEAQLSALDISSCCKGGSFVKTHLLYTLGAQTPLVTHTKVSINYQLTLNVNLK